MPIVVSRYVSMFALIGIATLGLAACGAGETEKKPPDPPPRPVGQNNVFGDMVATKDRARDDANKAMEQRQQQLEQAMKKQEEAANAAQ